MTRAGSASSSPARASAIRHRDRSCSPISFETARTSTAGTPASAAARKTPKPSIASTGTSRPTLPTAALVPIGRTRASGTARRAASTSRASPASRSTSADRRRQIAVHGFGPDHEGAGRELAAAGDSDVEHRTPGPDGQGPRRGCRRLDRADAADETVAAGQLPRGGGDDQDVWHGTVVLRRGLRRSYGRHARTRAARRHRACPGPSWVTVTRACSCRDRAGLWRRARIRSCGRGRRADPGRPRRLSPR